MQSCDVGIITKKKLRNGHLFGHYSFFCRKSSNFALENQRRALLCERQALFSSHEEAPDFSDYPQAAMVELVDTRDFNGFST